MACPLPLSRLHKLMILVGLSGILLSLPTLATEQDDKGLPPIRTLTAEQSERAAANYQKYCVLCHGENRQGHVNDHAPSLRSRSLFESGVPHAILRPLSYGRQGTAMGGYLDEVGGPLTLDETWDLTYWLFEQSGVERVAMSTQPVLGDIQRGEKIYQRDCAVCHGKAGEGITAPALGNASALAHNSDEFIRYAIQQGRQDTPMPAFSGRLTEPDIDNVTAFLRSRASGWQDIKPVLQALPTPDQYVVNPQGEQPDFALAQGRYVSSADLYAALVAKKKMVLLDTRVTSVWQTAHIEGSFPAPYYSDFKTIAKDIPRDVLIVAYCSCPRAAADYVIDQLKDLGFNHTAVLYEGIFGWMHEGYPVARRAIATPDDGSSN
ncbi:c-type cytochrome [Simiduia curdlanivorans]|uniref:C-type cytochrome n=1 Tax=Simiduia curdlanivorans TaxID=1492769 RepID=A0ABV8V760_9GAMM|nr:c-type cytochrome [Simiduia curdlanivorans]MDN3639087.1 c-type cytochrome [Simiduia curdlanivorans]